MSATITRRWVCVAAGRLLAGAALSAITFAHAVAPDPVYAVAEANQLNSLRSCSLDSKTGKKLKPQFQKGTRFAFYDVYGSLKAHASLTGTMEGEGNPIGKFAPAFDSRTPLLAVSNADHLVVRKPQNVSSQPFRSAVADFLRQGGVTVAMPHITHAYAIDLNNDGVDEYVVTADSKNSAGQADEMKNFYNVALVILKSAGSEKMQVLPLHSKIYAQGGETNVEYADVLGFPVIDGKTLIATNMQYYEGGELLLQSYTGKRVTNY